MEINLKQLTVHILTFLGVLGGTIGFISTLHSETRESVRLGLKMFFIFLYMACIYDAYIKPGVNLKIPWEKLLRDIFVVWIIPLILGILMMWYVFST